MISSNARVWAVLRDAEHTLSLFSAGRKFAVQFIGLRFVGYGNQIPKKVAVRDSAPWLIVGLRFKGLG